MAWDEPECTTDQVITHYIRQPLTRKEEKLLALPKMELQPFVFCSPVAAR